MDEILNLIESVFEGFPSYFYLNVFQVFNRDNALEYHNIVKEIVSYQKLTKIPTFPNIMHVSNELKR